MGINVLPNVFRLLLERTKDLMKIVLMATVFNVWLRKTNAFGQGDVVKMHSMFYIEDNFILHIVHPNLFS
jgi:hypothetical protein